MGKNATSAGKPKPDSQSSTQEKEPTIGRPTKYKEEFNKTAYELCLLGYIDVELAAYFGVSKATLNEWKKVHSEFMDSIRAGKEEMDAKVVQSLLKRANGTTIEEVTYEKIIQELDGEADVDDIKLEVYKKKVVTKEVLPDTVAAIFWLKNRQPKKFRDKTDSTVTNINTEPLTAEEVKAFSKALEDGC